MRSKCLLGAAMAALSATPAFAGGGCYRHVVSPAVYETVSERVVVEPARTVARHIPAEYGHVAERVQVQPARTIAHHVPAQYALQAETVQVQPATKVWQVTRDHHGHTVGCWVTKPAIHRTVHHMVRVREASVSHEVIPAVYRDVTRTVVTRPASVAHETIPAVYGMRHHKVLARPASSGWQQIAGCAR